MGVETNPEQNILEAGNDDLIVTYPDESLHDAVAKMVRNNIGRLPVISRGDITKPILRKVQISRRLANEMKDTYWRCAKSIRLLLRSLIC